VEVKDYLSKKIVGGCQITEILMFIRNEVFNKKNGAPTMCAPFHKYF
jgi:hypothetical protein